MCGITDIYSLLNILTRKTPILTDGTIRSDDLLFMCVKNYCTFSKQACRKLVKNNMTNVKIIDVLEKVWTTPNDITVPSCTHVPEMLLRNINGRFDNNETVPQIFVYKNNRWYYIGGCDSFMRITIMQPPLLKIKNEEEYVSTKEESNKDTPAIVLKW